MKHLFKQYEYNKSTLKFETGKVANQANGSVWLQYGKMVLLATVVIETGSLTKLPYMPLSTIYMEKDYARRLITGPAHKRESAVTLPQIIISRIIDRPIRPLFPQTYRNETNLDILLLSNDPAIPSDVMAISSASIALALSEAPFTVQMAGARVCKIDGNFILNPDNNTLKNCEFHIFVAGTKNAVTMIEGEGNNADAKDIIEAVSIAKNAISELVEYQEDFINSTIGRKTKIITPQSTAENEKYISLLDENFNSIISISEISDKSKRDEETDNITSEIMKKYLNTAEEEELKSFVKLIRKKISRLSTLNGFRADGRKREQVRKIECETGVLPSAHGSALFKRGDTQSLAVVTLGPERKDSSYAQFERSFFLHYNFPNFSVGEIKRKTSISRREYGHGFLAEKSLKCSMPYVKDFKHNIRIVSEILESDGSSSMATVCASALALKNAGVPVTDLTAGISIGLVKENGRYAVISDIDEDEDHYGDMDLKIAGTHKGVTGVQMDIKIDGVDLNILSDSFKLAEANRKEILHKMETLF